MIHISEYKHEGKVKKGIEKIDGEIISSYLYNCISGAVVDYNGGKC